MLCHFQSSVEMEMKEALRDLAKEKLEADQRVKESVVKQIELKAKNEALESKLDDERRYGLNNAIFIFPYFVSTFFCVNPGHGIHPN